MKFGGIPMAKNLAPDRLLDQFSPHHLMMKRILLFLLALAPVLVSAQTPQWIWPDRSEKNETVYFRKAFDLPAGKIPESPADRHLRQRLLRAHQRQARPRR